MKRIIYFLLIVLSWAYKTYAQDIEQEIRNMQSVAESEFISCKMRFETYFEEIKGEPVDVNNGKMIKKGDEYYQQIDHFEMIKSEQANLMINHEMRTIACLPQELPDASTMFAPDQLSVNGLLSMCESYQHRSFPGNKRVFELNFENQIWDKVIIEYDKNTYLPGRIEYYYAAELTYGTADNQNTVKPIMVILMDNYNLNQSKADSGNSIEHFLRRDNDKWVQSEAFSHYQLLGNITIQN